MKTGVKMYKNKAKGGANMPTYYTVSEASEILKVKPDTVMKWIKEGKIRASRLSNSKMTRISDDAIREFFDANQLHK